MLTRRSCRCLVHPASCFIAPSLPLLSTIIITLLVLTGSVGLSPTRFSRWGFTAQAAPESTSTWMPGLAKSPAYLSALATPVAVARPWWALAVWDAGAVSAQITSIPRTTATPTQGPAPIPTAMPVPSLSIPQLAPASGAPDRVVCAAIDLDQPVVTVGWHQETIRGELVSVWDVAQYAVGWHKNSKFPGQGGNVVLAGHNNIHGEVFRRLEDLRIGDVVTVHADDRHYDYTVVSAIIVKEEGATPEEKVSNARWIGAFPDERLTLVACYPYTGNSHRIIVIARPRFQVH